MTSKQKLNEQENERSLTSKVWKWYSKNGFQKKNLYYTIAFLVVIVALIGYSYYSEQNKNTTTIVEDIDKL